MSIENSITGENIGELSVQTEGYFGEARFVGPGVGDTTDVYPGVLRSFSIQVTGIGGGADVWDVRLEGSLDGINFTTCMKHTQALQNGEVLYSGATLFPVRYFRSRCVSVTLGQASAIVARTIGV